VSGFHAETLHATASEGLAQGPYVAARVGFKLAGAKPTTKPPCPSKQYTKSMIFYKEDHTYHSYGISW